MEPLSDFGSPHISVIIPVYNEGEIIGVTLSAVDKALSWEKSYEIIVVDDGSLDNTADIARKAGAKVIRHERNLGYGRALLSGFQHAKGDIIVLLNADLSFNPQDIRKLVENVENVDISIGSRYLGSARKSAKIPFYQTLANRIHALMIYFSTGVRVTDPDSSFRAIHKDKLDLLHLTSEDSSINYEMIAKAAKMGLRISEAPVMYQQWWRH